MWEWGYHTVHDTSRAASLQQRHSLPLGKHQWPALVLPAARERRKWNRKKARKSAVTQINLGLSETWLVDSRHDATRVAGVVYWCHVLGQRFKDSSMKAEPLKPSHYRRWLQTRQGSWAARQHADAVLFFCNQGFGLEQFRSNLSQRSLSPLQIRWKMLSAAPRALYLLTDAFF